MDVIGTSSDIDIGVLKVKNYTIQNNIPNIIADPEIFLGNSAMAIGSPYGLDGTITQGIISSVDRYVNENGMVYIQTDAAINRGNSGGPLFNLEGDVVGVNTAILSPNGGSIGIGFSMASNVVGRVVDQLIEFGEIRRGWLGVRIQDLDEDLVESIDGVDQVAGALVSGVPDGPAKDAGMKQNDVIMVFDGREVEGVRDLVQTVGKTEVGKAVDVIVVRNGKEVTLSVTLGLRDDEKLASSEDVPKKEIVPEPQKTFKDLGITLSNLTDEIRSGLGLKDELEGVVVMDVIETSEAYEKGLRSGDLIVEAGQNKITAISEFEEQVTATIEGGRKTMLLLVRRNSDPRFLALTIQK